MIPLFFDKLRLKCPNLASSQDDIELMHSLGTNAYRFSISWARILPSEFILRDVWDCSTNFTEQSQTPLICASKLLSLISQSILDEIFAISS